MALEDQVGTLTVQLNEKDEALAERTSQLIESRKKSTIISLRQRRMMWYCA